MPCRARLRVLHHSPGEGAVSGECGRISQSLVVRVCGVLTALGAVGSIGLPLTRRGIGSTISGARLADLVLSGGTPAPAAAGAGLYLVPVAGTLVAAGAVLGGRGPVRMAVVAAVALVGLLLAIASFLGALPDRLGPGLWVGAAPALLFLVVVGRSRLMVRSRGGVVPW